MYKADFAKLDLQGLRVYLMLQKRQVKYFTSIDPDQKQKEHAQSEVERAIAAIAEATGQAAGASGNSDAGEVGRDG